MEQDFVYLAQRAIVLTVLLSAPAVLAATVVGLMVALLQALTQVQEQTLQVTVKLVAVFGSLLIFGAWISGTIYQYALTIFQGFGTWVR